MSLFVYCPRSSNSVKELATALEAKRLKKFDGIDFWDLGKRVDIPEGSGIINYGGDIHELDGVRILNPTSLKFEDYRNKPTSRYGMLGSSGIYSPSIKPVDGSYSHKDYRNAGYIPRLLKHKGGDDLLLPPVNPDYYVQFMSFTEEIRIHSFAGRTLLSGKKVPIPGVDPHKWIRTRAGGWTVNYDYVSSKEHRTIAHKTIKVLGLMFGVVDLGLAGGVTYVIDVNVAPILSETTLKAYVKAILRWDKRTEVLNDLTTMEEDDES